MALPRGEPIAVPPRQKRLWPRPFVKWAGGKAQLIQQYEPLVPPSFGSYFEPFLGGGAVFLRLLPTHAVLSDINPELINAYLMVRDSVEPLIESLRRHRNEEQYYHTVRSQAPDKLSPIERASRFIYLNKTCYNGLYRVNRQGQFNVPFGRYEKSTICDAPNLRAMSLALRRATILLDDFEVATERASALDFVYLDPPYKPMTKTACFTGYSKGGFDDGQQERLMRVFCELHRRGCFVMLSNSDTPLIRWLYRDFDLVEVRAKRAINCNGDGRGTISELVIRNYR
ncbi:MAG: DNA adenine methylase [Chloroflexi bacterium]|nr:DNA adenine methylase [Chloroflexota bacterium]